MSVQSVTASGATQAPRAITGAVALIGFSAVIGQIVLMRELIVVFSGNEISLGIMLASWLFWTAIGSSVSRDVYKRQACRGAQRRNSDDRLTRLGDNEGFASARLIDEF